MSLFVNGLHMNTTDQCSVRGVSPFFPEPPWAPRIRPAAAGPVPVFVLDGVAGRQTPHTNPVLLGAALSVKLKQ